MRRVLCTGIAFGIASWAASAVALEADGTGYELGFRSGYSLPFGKAGSNTNGDLNKGVQGAVPLWLDLGYRVTPNVMVGVYGAYAFGLLGDALDALCPDGVDCSVHDIRLGAEVHYHFKPGENIDPWLGAGIGYEWLTFSQSAGNQDGSITWRGFELVNVQGGVDFAVSEDNSFALGPFVALSVAQFSAASCGGVCSGSGDIDTTTHEWLTFGVRGTYLP